MGRKNGIGKSLKEIFGIVWDLISMGCGFLF